jgi:hypothetical protein
MNGIQICPQNALWLGYNQINIYHYSSPSSSYLQQMSLAYVLLSASMLQIDHMAASLLGIQVSSLAPCTNSSTNQPTEHNIRQFQLPMPDMYSDLLWARWSGDHILVGATFWAPVQKLAPPPTWPHIPWVLGHSPGGGQSIWCVALTIHPLLALRSQ